MRARYRLEKIAFVTGVLLISTAACGGSSGGSTAKGPTSAGSSAAAAFLQEQEANPTSVGPSTPLATKPEAGRTVVNLTVPLAAAQRQSDSIGDAAKLLGWDYTALNAGSTPASAVSAFEAALARKPDAITYSGYPSALFTRQLEQAAEDGVTVLTNSTGEGASPDVLAELGGTGQLAVYGRIAAAYFAANAPEGSEVVLVSISAYPIFKGYIKGFEDGLKTWCPTCKVDVLDQQATDPGTKMPANIVAYLQRHPKVKWVNFANGDFSQGVDGAVKTAGLRDVRLIGEVPSPANLANVEAGTESAYVGNTPGILGWRMIDVLARHFEGSDLTDAVDAPMPTQIITRDNVGDIETEDGYYMGVAAYKDQFTKLWKLG